MDGSGPFLCAVRTPDHGDPPRHEAKGWVFQEFLCPALSADLASILLGPSFHVCDCSASASIRSPNRIRSALGALVVLSAVSPKFPRAGSGHGHRTLGCHLVPRCRGTVLPGLASGGAILQCGSASQDRYRGDLCFSPPPFLLVAASSQYLLKYILPLGRPDGRGTSGAGTSFE